MLQPCWLVDRSTVAKVLDATGDAVGDLAEPVAEFIRLGRLHRRWGHPCRQSTVAGRVCLHLGHTVAGALVENSRGGACRVDRVVAEKALCGNLSEDTDRVLAAIGDVVEEVGEFRPGCVAHYFARIEIGGRLGERGMEPLFGTRRRIGAAVELAGVFVLVSLPPGTGT